MKDEYRNESLERYLPRKNVHPTSSAVFLQTFRYPNEDKGIISLNWDRPFFEDDRFFIFIGGHVLYRSAIAREKKQVAPTPEQVLKIIESKGNRLRQEVKGHYCILLFDKQNKNIVIHSSPLSIYPAFFAVKPQGILFSNMIEAVIREKGSLDIYPQGLIEFSLFDHSLGMNTIYRGIYTLPGGARITVREGRIKEEIDYDLASWIYPRPRSRKDSLDEIHDVLKKVITDYITHIDHFNISLTGGFDGRLNLSFVPPCDYHRLQAFSYGKSGSLQIVIPNRISEIMGFPYKAICLDDEFVRRYVELGHETILLTGGITPFMRANYLYSYAKISEFSRNAILGQCDMIRPLFTNPAGAIFNEYAQKLFYHKDPGAFIAAFNRLRVEGFVKKDCYTREIADEIVTTVKEKYHNNYAYLSDNERYFLFLYKESMVKFWQTECHTVDLLVDDFISFADLDYIEALSSSEYFGLYKGIFARNQFRRRKAHDLYIDLMARNNDRFNDFMTDRLFKPKWLKYGFLGYGMAALGKMKASRRRRRIGNDTFDGKAWSDRFYKRFEPELTQTSSFFNVENMLYNRPYCDDNQYRRDRHSSLKIWLDHIGVQ